MSNLECVNFSLKTTSINSATDLSVYWNKTIQTPTGIIDNSRNTMTWFNVNLRIY